MPPPLSCVSFYKSVDDGRQAQLSHTFVKIFIMIVFLLHIEVCQGWGRHSIHCEDRTELREVLVNGIEAYVVVEIPFYEDEIRKFHSESRK